MFKTELKRVATAVGICAALVLVGCSKKPPVTAPPPPTTASTQPATDIAPTPSPSTTADPQEVERPKSLSDIQNEAEAAGLLGDVYYSFDQYDLRSEARERLAANARFMEGDGRELTFTIEGHCDERGTNEYNIALGQRRATSALDYLISLGVSRDRFKTISYGEEKPFCTESTEGCWQRNRRARFVVSGRR